MRDEFSRAQALSRRLDGWLFAVIGVLWLLLSGGCAVLVLLNPLIASISAAHGLRDVPWGAVLIVIVLAIPGALLLKAGIARIRRP